MIGSNADTADAQISPEAAHAAMTDLLLYYVKFRKVVKQKLHYARTSSQERLQALRQDDGANRTASLQRYEKLDRHLEKIASLLEIADLTVEDMGQIEETLNVMPAKILQRYEDLVHLDQKLMDLIRDITSDEYKQAYERARTLTETVQKGVNPMSGLPASEYRAASPRPAIREEQKKIKALRKKEPSYVILPSGEKVNILH